VRIWLRGNSASEGRPKRQSLDRAQVVRAALELLDEVGLDGLSMRRLADRLGVKAASVYWHVRDKEELLDLVFDRVIGEIEVPEPEPSRWRGQVAEVAHEMRRVTKKHRDIARVQLGRFPMLCTLSCAPAVCQTARARTPDSCSRCTSARSRWKRAPG
jgi:AcrR family transcriptional regulator